ncbi:unnamed protein product [Camellia sinensis]
MHDCPEVHANTAETLCAITRYAPPGLAAKITSPSFIGRLFCHALEDSRPKSVLVNSLSVCISLLDPKRLTLGTYHFYSRQLSHGSTISANPETVEGMLGSLGDLLKLLDVSSNDNALITTYGKLQPPLGKHCQKLKFLSFQVDNLEFLREMRINPIKFFQHKRKGEIRKIKSQKEEKTIELRKS